MKSFRHIIYALLLALLVMMPRAVGECYVTLKYKDVPFDFGSLSFPEEMYLVEFDIDSLLKRVEKDFKFQKEMQLFAQNEEYRMFLQMLEYLKKPEVKEHLATIKIYEGALYDGKNYRTVWFWTVQNNKELVNHFGSFFKGKITEEKKAAVLKSYHAWQDYANQFLLPPGEQIDYTIIKKASPRPDFQARPVFEVLDISPLEFGTVKNKAAWSAEVRFVGEVMESFIAGYSKHYVFNYKNKPVLLGFMSIDSERNFWPEIFDNALLDGPVKKVARGEENHEIK